MTRDIPEGTGAPLPPTADFRQPAGMKDVARLAGVSHQTVSRVINGNPHVRPDTRTRVLEAMQALGYRPNSAARALVTGRSRVIGVALMEGHYFGPASALSGVEGAAERLGYAVSVANVHGSSPTRLGDSVTRLIGQGVDGVVVIAPIHVDETSLDTLAHEVPLVAVQGAPEGRFSAVVVDQVQGARLATEHLLGLGHRTVWHVAGPQEWFEASDRLAAWQAVLEEAGAEVPPHLPGDWSSRAGYEAGLLLARMPEVTAVFTANDPTALGLLRAMAEHGRRVPEDVSVVGFDDVPDSENFIPPLTTVRQDFTAIGSRAVTRLLDLIESRAQDVERSLITPTLTLRNSTAPPRR